MGVISELFGYVLNALYNLLNNYGIAIIIFSVLLRLILIPLTIKQQKSLSKNSKIQDEMKNLQVKYKNNPEELNRATMELYKQEGVNPFSGCLTGILQIIIILAVFWLVSQPLTYMKRVKDTEIYNEYSTIVDQQNDGKTAYKEISIINKAENDYSEIVRRLENNEYGENLEANNEEVEAKVEEVTTEENAENSEENNKENATEIKSISDLKTKEELEKKKNELESLRINMEFLSLDLSKVPSNNLNDVKVLIIPILYVITSFISIKLSTKSTTKKEGDSAEQDSMNQMNKSMSYMMPIMSVSIAAIAPLGLALYWLVSNILMILERLIINKYISSKEEKENV